MDTLGQWMLGGGVWWGTALAFAAAAALVVVAGSRLSRYGDALGVRTGLGGGLAGLVFLASITSLPELVVSSGAAFTASAAAAAAPDPGHKFALLRGGADLAVGNVVGSNCFNLLLWVVIDAFCRGGVPFARRASASNLLSGTTGLALTGILVFGLALCGRDVGGTAAQIPFLGMGPVTPLIVLAYMAAMVLQHRHEKTPSPLPGDLAAAEEAGAAAAGSGEAASPAQARLLAMGSARFYAGLAGLALLIVIAGLWLGRLGDRMAEPWEAGGFGLGRTFVGSLFLAGSTSLPELVVCASAARMGALDLAAGNLLGSNLFNLAILGAADLALRGGSLLHYASPAHLLTAGAVLCMTASLMAALLMRPRRKWMGLGVESWLVLGMYLAAQAALFGR